jgi:formate dehydrogenase major subunit
MAPICGIEPDVIRTGRAHLRHGRARHHLLGHGHLAAHPRHRQCPLPDRAGADLRPGRPPGTGLHPLRGQNNVQGASDAGLIPMFLPDYQSVENAEVRAPPTRPGASRPLDPKRGSPWSRSWTRSTPADQGHVHHGREPGDVRPRLDTPARRWRKLEHLVVQDIFLTETASYRRRGPAGLRLAGEGRHGHQHQPPGADGPQGAAAARARRARTGGSSRRSPGAWASTGTTAPVSEVFAEMKQDAVARQHHLGAAGARGCGDLSRARPDDAGQGRGVRRGLPDDGGRGEASGPAEPLPPDEQPDEPTIPSCSRPAASSSTGTPAP